MPLEIIFKNGIFFSLFLSMLSFWGKSFQSENSFDLHFPEQQERSTDGGAGESMILNPSVPFAQVILALSQWKKLLKFFNSRGLNFDKFQAENFFLLSFFFITSELLFRWYSSGHPPLSNLYESLLFFIWGLIGFFLFWNFQGSAAQTKSGFSTSFPGSPRQKLAEAPSSGESNWLDSHQGSVEFSESQTEFSLRNFLGGVLSSAALFIETFADWRLPSEMKEMKPLIPALQSNWLLMHVSIMILSYAALLIGCLLAISYIALSSTQSVEFNSPVLDLRSLFLNDLDSLSFRVLAFGFPLLTLGILSGAVWANEAWGSYWSWDPKETWAFITWLIFAFYLHTRLQYGWEGKKSAFVATFGFFILWICYLGVNLLGKGLHSYGWLS
jgi:cytochrome c-type biogenesis protein CcsB